MRHCVSDSLFFIGIGSSQGGGSKQKESSGTVPYNPAATRTGITVKGLVRSLPATLEYNTNLKKTNSVTDLSKQLFGNSAHSTLVSTDNIFQPQIHKEKSKESCKNPLPRLQRAKSATIECKQWTALACSLPNGTILHFWKFLYEAWHFLQRKKFPLFTHFHKKKHYALPVSLRSFHSCVRCKTVGRGDG